MFKPRFRRNRIKYWASQYSYSQGYAEAVAVGRTARKRGYLTKNELIQFFDWKTGGRGRSRCLKNSWAYVKEVTRTSFSTSNARLRIEVLALLDGVDLRVASAILHLVFPRKYPIMDHRTLWSLRVENPKYNFELWDSYCNYCKRIAKENHVGLRTLDRALWQYSKENLGMIRRGKKGKYVIRSESGLLEDIVWKAYLKDYPIELVSRIRNELKVHIYGLAEKLNRKSRYFGYRMGKSADKVYIYIQKEKLRVDLCIGREHEEEIRAAGFNIEYVDNFQGRAGWLTGWHVPHDTKKMSVVIKWLLKAFEGNL